MTAAGPVKLSSFRNEQGHPAHVCSWGRVNGVCCTEDTGTTPFTSRQSTCSLKKIIFSSMQAAWKWIYGPQKAEMDLRALFGEFHFLSNCDSRLSTA